MPILIQCTNCARKLRVQDQLMGKTVKCPHCQTRFQARSVEEAGAATAAVNIATTGKSLRKFMPTSRSSSIAPLDPRTADVD